MLSTKKIFQEELKRLQEKYYMIDEGVDWLRLGTEDLKIIKELKRYKFNSTTGNAVYNFRGFDLILKTIGKQGTNYNFIRNYTFNELTIPINLFAITEKNEKNKIGYKYMINFYGLFFQLGRLEKLDVDEEINYILQDTPARITRVDYNYNFNLPNKKDIQEYIKKLAIKYADINNKSQTNNETFKLRYTMSKGRNDKGEVINGETKRIGLKRYDKTQNIIDLGLGIVFQQYEKQAVLRFEVLLGSQAMKGVNRNGQIKEIVKIVKNKLEGKQAIIDSQNKNKTRFITNEYIKKTKKTIETYLKTYLQNGGELEELIIEGMPLLEYVERKKEIDEILFLK